MFPIVLRVQTDQVPLSGCGRTNGPLRIVAIRDHRDVNAQGTKFDSRRSRTSDLDGAEVRVDSIFLHERVTDTQSAKYGGDDDGHVAYDD